MGKAKLLSCFSNKHLLKISKILPSQYTEVIERIRLNKYIEKTDFDNLNLDKRPMCIINNGEWDYPLFQMYFLSNMLANVVDCLSRGYLPVVDFRNTKDGINLWEQFLEQPYAKRKKEDVGAAINYDKKRAEVYFPKFPTSKDVNKYSKLIDSLLVLNEPTKKYVEDEYQRILGGGRKRVLGVLCRGTDYTSNKPKGHPVQPKVNDMIAFIKGKNVTLNCEYIYLATEEKQILEQFEAAFPGRILTNKRRYYDEFYKIKETAGDEARISWVHSERENDNYYKSLEYLSSLFLLSKCDALIAGNCGGSRAALYLNKNQYEYVHLFNLGMYE